MIYRTKYSQLHYGIWYRSTVVYIRIQAKNISTEETSIIPYSRCQIEERNIAEYIKRRDNKVAKLKVKFANVF